MKHLTNLISTSLEVAPSLITTKPTIKNIKELGLYDLVDYCPMYGTKTSKYLTEELQSMLRLANIMGYDTIDRTVYDTHGSYVREYTMSINEFINKMLSIGLVPDHEIVRLCQYIIELYDESTDLADDYLDNITLFELFVSNIQLVTTAKAIQEHTSKKETVLSNQTIKEIDKALTGHMNYPNRDEKVNYLDIMDRLASRYSGSTLSEKLRTLMSLYYNDVGVTNFDEAIARVAEEHNKI